MTKPNDVSIKVGDVTLSTANVPKDGSNLNKLDIIAKNLLSIFDKNNDGKLSATEINNAIIKLASADKTHTEAYLNDPDRSITTKKNGELDDVELETLKFELKALTLEERTELSNIFEKQRGKMDRYTHTRTFERCIQDENRTAFIGEIKNAAKELYKAMARENEINKNGLQDTYNDNWLKDKAGNHYRYNPETLSYEKMPNVEYVGKDGSYRTVNEKGQKIVHGHKTLQVLNNENKAYINADYAAETAGLTKYRNGYISEKDGTMYIWNDQKHLFEEAKYLTNVQTKPTSII